jgi:penicillin-binding protein 1A
VETIRQRLALLDVPRIPGDLSIALGNLGLSPLKMAQIYTVFSNQGHMIEPRLVSKIVSRQGAVLYETKPKEIADFTRPEQAYLMTDILRDVVRRGTGKRAQVAGIDLAGKTGTTNDGVDAWFCGYSPTITTIVWYGRDNNHPIAKRATGGTVAAPAFAEFYRKLLQTYPNTTRHFERPEGVHVGELNGRRELYTSISPLPGRTGARGTGLADLIEGNQTDAQEIEEVETLEETPLSDMEVIQLEETPVEEDPIFEPARSPEEKRPIDPLHLQPRRPKADGNDGGKMF